ncbi:MAG: glycosyltransferase N-terminal domain-containing protein [Deltaproteobacteria bacterium]|nr:glycosyltransferase N-terminal domain-containing protein [Deltaproteobacteria bacterium]
MTYILYDILLHIFTVALIPYFFLKMLTARKYREGIPERLGFIKEGKLRGLLAGRTVWVHAVSVGEAKAVMPVLRLLKKRRPGVKVVFSTVTKTGQATAAQDGAGLIDSLIYFPLDLSWAVRKAVRKINPSVFVVVEKEVWPNCFRTLSLGGVPIAVVNGTISERSFRRFRRFGFFFRGVFGSVSFFGARTRADRDRAVGAGVSPGNAVTTGNIKFDLSPPSMDKGALEGLKKALGVKEGSPLIVAGSTHAGEEEAVLGAYRELKGLFPDLRLVIAPRHPERFSEVESLIKRQGLKCVRRSKGGGGEEGVLLLDTVGELMMVYSFSTVAVVGGSIAPGIGGHNLLEPAYYGKPVVYGGRLTTYLEMAGMLEAAGGGLRVEDNGLAGALGGLLDDDALRERMGRNARAVVEQNRGAAEKSVAVIERYIRG